jgi:hypothetical protein
MTPDEQYFALVTSNVVGGLKGLVHARLPIEIGEIRIYLQRNHPVTEAERKAVLACVDHLDELRKKVEEYSYR